MTDPVLRQPDALPVMMNDVSSCRKICGKYFQQEFRRTRTWFKLSEPFMAAAAVTGFNRSERLL
jgi:hypothetical protein